MTRNAFLRGQVPFRLKRFSTLPAPKRQAQPAGAKAIDKKIAQEKRSEIARLYAVLRFTRVFGEEGLKRRIVPKRIPCRIQFQTLRRHFARTTQQFVQ